MTKKNNQKNVLPGSLEHFGEKCLIGCNDQEGNCDWCGDDGLCCKKGSIGNGCDGTIGGTNNYLCVNKHGNTVSAQLERRGSIFQKGFLGEVQFEFNIPGVLIKKVD